MARAGDDLYGSDSARDWLRYLHIHLNRAWPITVQGPSGFVHVAIRATRQVMMPEQPHKCLQTAV